MRQCIKEHSRFITMVKSCFYSLIKGEKRGERDGQSNDRMSKF